MIRVLIDHGLAATEVEVTDPDRGAFGNGVEPIILFVSEFRPPAPAGDDPYYLNIPIGTEEVR
jgi:hypothetical protein